LSALGRGRPGRVVAPLYAGRRAALALARRLGRIGASGLREAARDFESLHDSLDLVEVPRGLVREAGGLVEQLGLRASRAVHLASAGPVADAETVLATGDRGLLAASRAVGLATAELVGWARSVDRASSCGWCALEPSPGQHSRCATLSHMEIGVRDLRNRTGQVIDAVRAGERVVLTVHGEAVADIVPHAQRCRWVPGDLLRRELAACAADPGLREDLEALAGQTLDEL
jgi:prevent-host-death family protein